MKYTKRQYIRWLTNIAVAACIIAVILFLFPVLLNLFMPFVIGWIVAMLANPLVKFLEGKIKIKRKAGSAIVIGLVIAVIVLVIYLITVKLIREAIGFAAALPDMMKGLEKEFAVIGDNLSGLYDKLPENIQSNLNNINTDIGQIMGKMVDNYGTPTIASVGYIAKNIPGIIIGIIMSVLSAYAFVAEKNSMTEWLKKNVPVSIQEKWGILTSSTKQAVGGYFRAQLIIEIWVYIILIIGLMVLRVRYAALIAFAIAVLDFLPFFGAGAIMLPWALIKLLSGDYKMAIALLIIWGVGQLVRQVIQPKIMGDNIGIDMIPALILLYIGYRFYGVIGMIFVLPLGIIIINLNKAGVFDTTKNSIRLLIKGINDFRRLTPEEIESVQSKEEQPETLKGKNK
ncbi:MAG: sporulation integral membrane protein YtvI [Lachnospiraceae bacterium]|nr:sporulation integral membrane protein YtvI [Lachnospiraceae bacterium]